MTAALSSTCTARSYSVSADALTAPSTMSTTSPTPTIRRTTRIRIASLMFITPNLCRSVIVTPTQRLSHTNNEDMRKSPDASESR